MTASKFVEHIDNDYATHDRELRLETNHSSHGRTSTDSSTSSKSHDSSSPSSGERVYRDRFPSPARKSMDSPTDSSTRRKLKRFSLRKDA